MNFCHPERSEGSRSKQMFNIYRIFNTPYGYYKYIWIDCTIIKETQKAILIMFDDRKIWLPKAWVVKIRNRRSSPASAMLDPDTVILSEAKDLGADAPYNHKQPISIKISLYHWVKKFC